LGIIDNIDNNIMNILKIKKDTIERLNSLNEKVKTNIEVIILLAEKIEHLNEKKN